MTPTPEELAKSFAQTTLPDSEVELVGEIPPEALTPLQEKALVHFQAELELPGFRKGHVPADMVRKKVGDIALLEEAVELFMRDFYPTLVQTLGIDAVGRPNIRITKLVPGNPVGISIRTTVYPQVELPKNWQSIAEAVPLEPAAATEEREIDEALESIRRAHAKATTKTETEVVESGFEALPQSPAAAGTEPAASVSEHLPELNDNFARSLGNFADLADLKRQMRENLDTEKAQKMKDARRGKIIDKLVEQSEVAVPAIFVESELEKIMAQMRDDLARYGLTFEEYLKRLSEQQSAPKTEEDIRNDFRDQARKRAKLQLLLNKIAEEEKVAPDKDAIEDEMKHALEHFPDARSDLLRVHVETVLRNEKVLQLLEGQPKETQN